MMKDIATNFTIMPELVIDKFAGTFATGKEWMIISRHRTSVECEIDAECYEASSKWLMETYASQSLIEKLNIIRNQDVLDECKAVV